MRDDIIDLIIARYKHFKRQRRSHNAFDYIFCMDDQDCGMIDIKARVFVIPPEEIESCSLWIHEFSELTIIDILTREGYDWRKSVHFKGYEETYIAHFITPMGGNNKCSLFPEKPEDKDNW